MATIVTKSRGIQEAALSMWEAERDNSWLPESANSSLAFAAAEVATGNKVFSTVSAMLTMRVERQNSGRSRREVAMSHSEGLGSSALSLLMKDTTSAEQLLNAHTLH